MLDPRIYRNAMMIVALALIVVAFSLGNQPSPLTATLVPDSFSGANAYQTMTSLAARFPDRRPGSAGDNQVADYVANALSGYGFQVNRAAFNAQTVDGPRTIQTVTGTLAGTTPGTIVVVAHRDAPRPGGAGSPADASGTAVLLELARVLSAQTQQRSVVLASTSAQVGAAGAAQLARSLPAPVDAVIVLGNMAGVEVRSPIVVPWSSTQLVAPPLLRNTVAAALSQQANLTARDEGLGGQFLHLAFPLASTEQRPFAANGQPAVLVSTSGARVSAADEPTSQGQIDGFGRTILQSVSALESGATVGAPSSYLRWSGMLIPAWAIRVLVLALILPVLAATIDGMARARRRGHRIARWIAWVLSACVPFVLAVLAVLALHATGVIDAPPGPVTGDTLTVAGKAVAILIGLGCLIVLGFIVRWRLGRHLWATEAERAPAKPVLDQPVPPEPDLEQPVPPEPDLEQAVPAEHIPDQPVPAEHTPAQPVLDAPRNGRSSRRRHRGPEDPASPGAAAALLLVLCVITVVIWVENPFAAALIVPALHLWMWVVAPERRPQAPLAVLLFVAGLVPGLLAAYYYATTLGLGAAEAAWNAVLMLAGGSVSVMSAIEWSVVLGCVVSLALMIVKIARRPRPQPAETPITVRGPISYAGPGSLGGTRSALRR